MTIRAAILGYGRNGSTMHAGALERHPGFEVVAVCDVDRSRLEAARQRFGCPTYEDYHQMLRNEKLDLVCIVTRSDQHAEMTCACLAAGVNVLVTKPWATSAAEGRRMMAAAQAAGRHIYPWLPARWGCQLRRLQQLVQEQVLGDIFLIRRINTSFATRADWQTERRFGGGYLLNWGPHLVDPPLVLTGQKVKTVYGCLRRIINPGDAEDLFLTVLVLQNGCIVQAEHTVATQSLPEWVIQGTKGTITVRQHELTIHQTSLSRPADPTKYANTLAAKDGAWSESLKGSIYGDEHEVYADLYKAYTAGEPFLVSPNDALYLSQVFDSVRESSEKGKIVEMPV